MDREKSLAPFNIYDVFAYLGIGLATGTVLYALAVEYPGPVPWSRIAHNAAFDRDWVLIPCIAVASYGLGHGLAHLSYPLYDRLLVHRFFGSPADHALGSRISGKVDVTNRSKVRLAVLYALGVSEYERSLAPDVTKHVKRGDHLTSSSNYYSLRTCFTIVNEQLPRTSARISTFLDIYSFCRNGSLALLVLALAAVMISGGRELPITLAFLVGAWILLGRYLRFLKFYTDEIYIGYAAFVTTLQTAEQRPSGEDGGTPS